VRTVSLMGSTGSVGTQALDVIRTEPERFRVHALAAQRSVEELLAQAASFAPALVVIGDPGRYREVRDGVPAGTEVMVGEDAEDGQNLIEHGPMLGGDTDADVQLIGKLIAKTANYGAQLDRFGSCTQDKEGF